MLSFENVPVVPVALLCGSILSMTSPPGSFAECGKAVIIADLGCWARWFAVVFVPGFPSLPTEGTTPPSQPWAAESRMAKGSLRLREPL